MGLLMITYYYNCFFLLISAFLVLLRLLLNFLLKQIPFLICLIYKDGNLLYFHLNQRLNVLYQESFWAFFSSSNSLFVLEYDSNIVNEPCFAI